MRPISDTAAGARWITIEAERVLYVSRGRDVILCDGGHSGPVTLLVKIADSTPAPPEA